MNDFPPASPTRGSFTTASAPHSLRPRQKRLISGLGDLSEDVYAGAVLSPIASPNESPFFSRSQSPIPSKHPSRSSSSNPLFRQPTPGEQGSDLASSLSGLWGRSWTSLQGLASNVLGSDATIEPIKDNPQRVRRPPPGTRSRANISNGQWGPSPTKNGMQPGGGSREERAAVVRAKKREEMLKPTNGVYSNLDRGSKRRTSDEYETASSAPPGDTDDRDTLVYIHHVTPADTLPGISLKFGCSLQVVRQANRLWSNDGIQFRKTLVLPVDACTIKGRRVAAPTNTEPPDLFSEDAFIDPDQTPKASTSNPWTQNRTNSDTTITPLSHLSNGTTPPTPNDPSAKPSEDTPWKHDSWLLLTNFATPTELARLPRSELGFFPRARRKSVSYSDLDTPASSLDLQRPTPSVTVTDSSTSTSTATDRTTSTNSNSNPHRHRRLSSTERFAQQIIGRSGGVGPLVGKGPSAPGAADDKLTQVINKHIPGMIPAPAPTLSTPADDDTLTSGTSTPTGLGLEQMGGAIEGWVRKMARNAARAIEPSANTTSPRHAGRPVGHGLSQGGAGGRGGQGYRDVDLIELSDAFELGEDEGDEGDSSAAEDKEREKEREKERGRARDAVTANTSASAWGGPGNLVVRERAAKNK